MRWEGFQYFLHWLHCFTWPQVIDISKIREIQVIGTSGLIKFWKLENILLTRDLMGGGQRAPLVVFR